MPQTGSGYLPLGFRGSGFTGFHFVWTFKGGCFGVVGDFGRKIMLKILSMRRHICSAEKKHLLKSTPELPNQNSCQNPIAPLFQTLDSPYNTVVRPADESQS